MFNMGSSFDYSVSICPNARLSDLDSSAIETFRCKCLEKSGNSRLKTLTPEQLLRDCEAVTDEGVTYAALILFGKSEALNRYLPQSKLIFEYHTKNQPGPASQREEFHTGFFDYFDRVWDLINLRNDRQHYHEGFFVFDIPTFNERVVREAILNAVCHRDYQMGWSIFVRQYPDKVIIESPGGLPKGITPDNVLDRQMPRNRRIAEILAFYGLSERSGQGMNLMYELSVQEAKPLPDFTGTHDACVCLTLNGKMMDEKMVTVMHLIGEERLGTLTTSDFLTIDKVYFERSIPNRLRPSLKKLIGLGIIESVGRKRYRISSELCKAAENLGVYLKKPELNREAARSSILSCIQNHEDRGVHFRELRQVFSSLSRNQLRSLMAELKRDKRIFVTGQGCGALWFPESV